MVEVTGSLRMSCGAFPWGRDVGETFTPGSGLQGGTQGTHHSIHPPNLPYYPTSEQVAALGTLCSDVSGSQGLPWDCGVEPGRRDMGRGCTKGGVRSPGLCRVGAHIPLGAA